MKHQTIAPRYRIKAKLLDALGVTLLMIFMAAMGCILMILSTPTAKADIDHVAYAYAAAYGDAVCSTLDSYPTLAGVSGIGQAIRDDGLTLFQAGQVIEISVHEICPRHLGLLDRFIQTYSPRSAIA